jgi:homoserine/homoserine lactone efflux protein
MDLQLYLAFVLATVLLALVPGPNVALIVANSVAYGTRYGLLTVAGTSSAMALQLALTAFGMTTMLGILAQGFEWIRWLGVAYLVYLGVMQWRSPPTDLTKTRPLRRSAGAVYARGFLVSLTNPKTLLFFSAFFPQFITLNDKPDAQIALLSATFLVLALFLDGAWAVFAGQARGILAMQGGLRNRLSGGLLIGAGIGLALAHTR